MSAVDAQARVQALIDHRVASGDEVGVQVAAVEHGRVVVDAVSGAADPDRGRAVAPGTLFLAASTAKGVASSVAHVLVERGELAYDLRAAEVWPEFGAHGKDRVTLRHVRLHTAGMPAPPYDTWWLREVVTVPLGTGSEVHFGVPEELLDRVARAQPPTGPPPPPPEPGSPVDRALPPAIRPDADYANRRDVLTSDIPSEGTMTARGAALLYAALLGDVDGVELVSPARRAGMAAVQFEGQDEVMGFPSTWAFGFSPQRPGGVPSRPGSTFGMVGMNGSAAYADIDSGVTLAVMRNRFDTDLGLVSEIDRIAADLGGEE